MVDPTWWRRRWTRFLTRHTLASEQVDGPAGFDRYTDIEPLRRNSNALVEGEEVVLTEKIHGANARFGVDDAGNFWVGSHNNWLSRPGKLAPKNWWWAAALQEGLEERLKAWKGFVFYGEVYGPGVQKGFPYDEASNTHISVRFFDIKNTQTGRFMSHDEMWQTMGELNLAVVPMLYRGPWKKELRAAAEGKSVLADHLREGFVVRPAHERVELGLGRVVLKHVGEGYHLARAKEHE
jgi:RNA ligase (TIGR02306 family)